MKISMPRWYLAFPLYLQTIVALFFGGLLGWIAGPDVAPIGEVAKGILVIIKNAAIPLLFAAILDTVLRAELKGRAVGRLVFIAGANALAAVTIALLISNVFHPGRSMALKRELAAADFAVGPTAQDGLRLFLTSPMILAILSALALGLTVLAIGVSAPGFQARVADPLRAGVARVLAWMMGLIEWLVRLVPIAVFCAVARAIGVHGFGLLTGLGVYLIVCLGGMALQVFAVYHSWIALVAHRPLREFWREAREPVTHAFGINSSLATLPITLRALERLRVSPAAARLSACVGTNFNNDGILLYEVVAVLFLAQAYGMDWSISQQLLTAGVCVVATLGVGGIPEAGLVALTLVMSSAGLPPESVTLLLPVDWIVARARSATNVTADLTVALGIDALASGGTPRAPVPAKAA